ncbi:AAA family ATPase [Parafilimonas sp.]|uniref:AAA family ATPase n=1 Tax=Parafilimonas sp. TaxID=1969739 RepID=UPI0039E56598
MTTKNNFYIITGGPGAGKTTLLENLSTKGYSFVPETARQIIKNRLALGQSPRPDPLSFAKDIFDTDYLNFRNNNDVISILFFDRSFLDSAWQIATSDINEYNLKKDILQTHRYNNKVFIAPPWKDIYQTDAERDQTFEQSIVVFEQLCNWYLKHNYDIVELPKTTVDNRITFVLNHLPDK